MDSRARSSSSSFNSGRTGGETVRLGKLPVTQHGWLYQRGSGSFLRGWRHRLVVLSDERLYIFKDAAIAGCPVSAIDLSAFQLVQRAAAPGRTKFGFVLRSERPPSVFGGHVPMVPPPPKKQQPSEDLELYADTEAELEQWISALTDVLVPADVHEFQSPLSSFDAAVNRVGKSSAPSGSILTRLERQRETGRT
ncbi:hypothetical protein IWQ56_004859, partial [Coemansia nantahalensis]